MIDNIAKHIISITFYKIIKITQFIIAHQITENIERSMNACKLKTMKVGGREERQTH